MIDQSSATVIMTANTIFQRRHSVEDVMLRFIGSADQLTELFNRGVIGLIESPKLGRFVNRNITRITYKGRRSGKIYSLPVGYVRVGNTVTIRSQIRSDRKSWWRNFLGTGAPLSIWMDGADRAGHATAVRHPRGSVAVTVRLDTGKGA
jgi:hypothetical protein